MTNQQLSSRRLMTQTEYAAHRGCSKQYIHQLVKQGRIPLTDGRIDPVAADAALARDRDPARPSHARPRNSHVESLSAVAGTSEIERSALPFAKARAVREHYRARREQMEFERLCGELVPLSEVRDALFTLGRAMRRLLDHTGPRIGAEIAAQLHVDAQAATEIASKEIRATQEEMVRRLKDQTWLDDLSNSQDGDDPDETV